LRIHERLQNPMKNQISTSEEMASGIRAGWPEWAVLLLYAAAVALAIPYHEPWADEAQAWQLARTLSLPTLFQTYIRYEGSPGLWHFLLWILIRLHVGYTGLHWICGAIAVAATALLVFRSPFPRYIKSLLPFTYFLLFQYAVVARSYVLVPLLLYLIALCWKKSPIVLALLLGLLGNVALHAAMISGGLAAAYLIEQIRCGGNKDLRRRRQFMLSALVLSSLWAFAIWTAWPPHDLTFKPSGGPLIPLLLQRIFELCRPWGLPIAFWIAIVICFRARCALSYLLPVLFCGLFCLVEYASMWHVGLLYPVVICLLWITWPVAGGKIARQESVGRTALLLMAALQILWSAYAIRFDHYEAYSPDLATADFLRPMVQHGEMIAVTSMEDPVCDACRSVGILPYFDRNVFVNMEDPFWFWSTRNQTEKMFNRVLPARPAVVVVEMLSPKPGESVNFSDPKIELLGRAGYGFTNMFCGILPSGLRLGEKSCHLIFQRVGGSQESSLDHPKMEPMAK